MTEVGSPRLFGQVTPESAVVEAEEQYGPFIARVCLFSGGNDSLVAAHRCIDLYDELVFIDTGTAVPGVREFVEEVAHWLVKPLRIYEAAPGEYRRIVLGGEDERGKDWKAFGFPGPAHHGWCYTRLKQYPLERMRRELQDGVKGARVLALSGVRQAESARRRHRPLLKQRGSMVFCAPLLDWTHADLAAYRAERQLPESDVAALLHRSGECNCGAFAVPGAREELQALWPEWFADTIGRLEREAGAMELGSCRWGAGEAALVREEDAELCSDCQLRLDA